MKKGLLSLLPLAFLFVSMLCLSSCRKEVNMQVGCYDPALVHEGFCTHDCPGFEGCDGNFYCNECEAARVGIGPR